jgi:glycosyltransferase involved in cell wall biosynthesis
MATRVVAARTLDALGLIFRLTSKNGGPSKVNPLVSVIVTTFNHEAYISEALESVFAQTYAPVEVIVVNDGSSDGTESAIAPFRNRIRYMFQENQGVAGSRNAGIRKANGQFLAFLDGDDLWEPEKLAIQVQAANQYPEAGIIATNGVQFSSSEILNASLLGAAVEVLGQSGDVKFVPNVFDVLIRGNIIYTTSQVMIPRKVFEIVGLSDRRFRIASDYDLYLRIASRYGLVTINKTLVKWRYHSASASGVNDLRPYVWAEDCLNVLHKLLKHAYPSKKKFLRCQIRKKVYKLAIDVYYEGSSANRRWLSRYLLRLFARNPAQLRILPYVIAFHLPSPLTSVGSYCFKRRQRS